MVVENALKLIRNIQFKRITADAMDHNRLSWYDSVHYNYTIVQKKSTMQCNAAKESSC